MKICTKESLRSALRELTERLAAIEHERWAHWQRYMHGKGVRQADGSMLIAADLVARWEKQMMTAYGELDDGQKESDRDQVKRYLPLIETRIGQLLED